MMRGVGANGVRLGADGRLEVVRCAPPEEPAALRRTVERLRAAAGPGVVEVLACTDDGDEVELVLAFAGRALEGPMTADALVPLVGSLAAHLGDLHLRGIAHGAVAPEHVLVDASDAVRLCGFTDGEQADDVAAVGRLIDTVLDADDTSAAATSLRAIAARCTNDDPSGRPTMAAVAASLATTRSTPRSVRVEVATPAPRSRRVLALAAAVVSVLVAVGALATTSRAESSAPMTTMVMPSTTSTSEAQRPSPPRRFEHDGVTWELGTDRDQLLLGDWDCDAVATPALLTDDGALYVIDEWPDGDALASRLITTVPDARRAEGAAP